MQRAFSHTTASAENHWPVGYPAFDEGYRDHGNVPLRANHHRPGTWASKLWNAGWAAAALDGDYRHPAARGV